MLQKNVDNLTTSLSST